MKHFKRTLCCLALYTFEFCEVVSQMTKMLAAQNFVAINYGCDYSVIAWYPPHVLIYVAWSVLQFGLGKIKNLE